MLSVVMPAHNESGYLRAAVEDVVGNLKARELDFEVVVVENGSTDDSAAIARGLDDEIPEVRAISLAIPDYGGALRTGFLEARGDVVAIFDVDYYDFQFLDDALALAGRPDGPDVVVGSKRGAGAVDTRGLKRRLVTETFSLILRAGFGLKVADTHGIKLARRAPLTDLADASRTGADIFDTELILRAERAGLKVVAIPVTVEETRPSRSSIVKRIPRTIVALARLRLALWREARQGAKGPASRP